MQAEKHSLAPAIVGAIIGALVGIGLHVVLETGMLGTRVEASWFAIVIGVLTGLGVRQANRHHMERSYLRGAISAIIALAAIVASSFVVKEVMSRREVAANTGKSVPGAEAKDEAAKDDAADEDVADADAADADEPADEAKEAPAARRADTTIGAPKGGLADPNPWEFVFMALGGLVAYELGRGIDHSKRTTPAEGGPSEPTVGGTDPSN